MPELPSGFFVPATIMTTLRVLGTALILAAASILAAVLNETANVVNTLGLSGAVDEGATVLLCLAVVTLFGTAGFAALRIGARPAGSS